MRFLCLHGYATCENVLLEMMEPITEHLPSDWEYEFLEAGMDSSKLVLPELDQVPPPNYSWYNFPEPEAMRAALDRLISYIDSEGPFDGLWGFSQGAAMATLLLLEHQKANPGAHDWPFKMVIYNSTFLPYRIDGGTVTWDYPAKSKGGNTSSEKKEVYWDVDHKTGKVIMDKGGEGQLVGTYQPGEFDASFGKNDIDWKRDDRTKLDHYLMNRVKDEEDMVFPMSVLMKYRPEDVPDKLTVPSVHVRGVKDDWFFVDDSVYSMFDPNTAKKMTHRGGHHFPRHPDELVQFAEMIIETAGSLVI